MPDGGDLFAPVGGLSLAGLNGRWALGLANGTPTSVWIAPDQTNFLSARPAHTEGVLNFIQAPMAR